MKLALIAVSLAWSMVAVGQDSPRSSDVIGADLEARLGEVDRSFDSARAKLQALLEERLEAAAEADVPRLQLELESFEVAGVLPASVPEAAREFALARRARLKAIVAALDKAIERYGARGDEGAVQSAQGLREDAVEQLDLVDWDDLRCRGPFADAVKRSGFSWEGAALMSPANGDAVLRLPSTMDRPELIGAYQLRLEVERVTGEGPLRIFFPLPDRPAPDRELACVVLDDAGSTRFDAMRGNRTSPKHEGRVLKEEAVATIAMTCRTNGIRVEVDGEQVLDLPHGKHLQMPQEWIGPLARNRTSFHLAVSNGSRVRVLGASFRELLPDSAARPVAASTPRKGPTDHMPHGRVWNGRLVDGPKVRARVIARNQARSTATIELRASNGWLVHLPVRTDATGATFEIDGARRLDAKVRLFGASGKGSAGPAGMEMNWRWNSVRNHPCSGRSKRVAEGAFRSS